MPLAKDAKSAIIEDFATHEGDSGSPEVQIALLTERIQSLTEHLRTEIAKWEKVTRAAGISLEATR